MAQPSGRLTCPRCGANNFETVAACWKCGAALGPAAAPVMTVPPMNAPPLSAPYGGSSERSAAPLPYAAPLQTTAGTGDSGVATRAAIALALTLPWIGLPVGWVFMMIEDRRKQAIGRICAVWSMIALVFHLLLMGVLMQGIVSSLVRAALSGAMRGGGGTSIPELPPGAGGNASSP